MPNHIHPTAIITGDVDMGDDNVIHAYAVLHGPLKLGNRNTIGPHATVGTPGQDTRDRYYDSSLSAIELGDDNIVREFTTIQKPAYESVTRLGSRVFLMSHVHVPHDARIEDDVVITPMVAIAGLTRILQGANLALGVKVQQRAVIGQYSIAAMGSVVLKNIRPFTRYIPGRQVTVNTFAIDKFGFSAMRHEIEAYVHEREAPRTSVLQEIVFHYEELNQASGCGEY